MMLLPLQSTTAFIRNYSMPISEHRGYGRQRSCRLHTRRRKNKGEIDALNERSKLERANLKQANLVRNLTILGIVGVLAIAILLYRQSRLRKKTNEVIVQKNDQLQHLLTEKEWLLKRDPSSCKK